jgi:hypothetical protein
LPDPFRPDVVGDVGGVALGVAGASEEDLHGRNHFHPHDVGSPVTVQTAVGRRTPMAMRSSTRNETRLFVYSVSPNWLTPIVIPNLVHASTACDVSKTMAVPAGMNMLTTTVTPQRLSTWLVLGSGDSLKREPRQMHEVVP